MLAYIRIWYFERETRELVRINQCELIESFMDVQKDYSSAIALALVSEITDSVLGEREAADAQFRLILLTARAIRSVGPSQVVPGSMLSLWEKPAARNLISFFRFCGALLRGLQG
jgi:DNA repair protein RecO (recombination protein O)